MIANIGLIVTIGVLWRIWMADLPQKDSGRIVVSLIATGAVALLAIVFFTGSEL